jgi:sigma-B regulation protein RsbU (phosphoserine phosphatase)
LKASGQVVRLESTGLPLGILDDEAIPCGEKQHLSPGDVVLLATDGLTELCSPSGEFFGVERALDVVRACRERTASQIVEALHASAHEFSHGASLPDDQTIVILKRIS